MKGHEYLEIEKLCEDLNNEIKKRVFDNPNCWVRLRNSFGGNLYYHVKKKLKIKNLPLYYSPYRISKPPREIDSSEVPKIKEFLIYAKREVLFYRIKIEHHREMGYCRGINDLWNKASFKYKNQVCFYEGKYVHFEALKRKLNTETAKAFLLPKDQQIKLCIYEGETFEFWQLCHKLRIEKVSNPYEIALSCIQ